MLEILKQISVLLSALSTLLSPQLGGVVVPVKIELNGKEYTQTEYDTRKNNLIVRVEAKKSTHFDNRNDFQDWVAILNRECKGKSFDGMAIEKLNQKLKTGCL